MLLTTIYRLNVQNAKPDVLFQSPHVTKHSISTEQACLALIGCIRFTAWKGRPPSEVGKFAECLRPGRWSVLAVDNDECFIFVFCLCFVHLWCWTSRYKIIIDFASSRSAISALAELLLWPPYGIGQAIIFLPCGFFLSSIFLSFFFA